MAASNNFFLNLTHMGMYYVKKTLEVSASHQLKLDYESKCQNLHGHNWVITVYCRSRQLDANGMVCDFSKIKSLIKSRMDHCNLNEQFSFNSTAENIARWIVDNVPNCYRADVCESQNNEASYVDD